MTAGKLSTRSSYVCLIITAIALVWSANVFEIITLASRVFAMYYLLQCLVAIGVALRIGTGGRVQRILQVLPMTGMGVILAIVVLFATPVA